jgi:hypothetical protein
LEETLVRSIIVKHLEDQGEKFLVQTGSGPDINFPDGSVLELKGSVFDWKGALEQFIRYAYTHSAIPSIKDIQQTVTSRIESAPYHRPTSNIEERISRAHTMLFDIDTQIHKHLSYETESGVAYEVEAIPPKDAE